MYSLTHGAEALAHERGLRGGVGALGLRAAARVQAGGLFRRGQPASAGEAALARARGRRVADGGALGRLARRGGASARRRARLARALWVADAAALHALGVGAVRCARG